MVTSWAPVSLRGLIRSVVPTFSTATALAALLALTQFSGAAQAEVLFACVDQGKSGKVRFVNSLSECKQNETGVSWNVGDTDTQKYIFVTDLASKGNKGGLTGADSTCQSEAEANLLPGDYKAWLSITVDGPQTTFIPARVPYVLPGSLDVVANDWRELERLGVPEIARQDRRGEADLIARSLRTARRQIAVAHDPPAPGRVRQMRIRLDKTGNFRLHRLRK